MTEKNIHSLSPDFSIPPGTQVVLKQDLSFGDQKRKAGNVGVVLRSPPTNEEPYIVRFADESEMPVRFEVLAMRRREIENLLAEPAPEELKQFVIYKCQVGSHAFGLANEDSDTDWRGIYLPPADRHWSLIELPGQLESNDGEIDEVYWEFEKFIRLALKANPNILELLWTPRVELTTPIADRLLESRRIFLSRHIYKTYSGYVLSQFRRMKQSFEKKSTYKTKHAMHLIRLLYSGISALQNGEIMIDVSNHRDQLLSIKAGDFSFAEVRELALKLDKEFQTAFEETDLPEQPDFAAADQLLIEARRSQV